MTDERSGDDQPGDRPGHAEREYQLGPDGTPVDAEGDREPPAPETAAEYRRAARRALSEDDVDTAIEHLDEAVERARDAGDDTLAAGALTDRGNARLERADADDGDPRAEPDREATRRAVEAAIEDYTAALDHIPDNREALFNRGLARARLGEREDSTRDLERAAELGAGHPFLVRGNVYAEAGADEHAREDFSRAIDRTGAARAYFNRGNANRRLGDTAAAVADYEAALDRAGDLPDEGLRVLVELADATESETAATHLLRAAFLAVARRDVWGGVSLAERALAAAAEGGEAWLDAAAVVVAGDAIRGAAGYDDGDPDTDIGRLRAALAEADLPERTAALVAAANGADAVTELDDLAAPNDLAGAVADRDDAALREAAVAALGRQLRVYR